MFMKKRKIKYDVANNGREAVDRWKTGGFHLVLVSSWFFFVLYNSIIVSIPQCSFSHCIFLSLTIRWIFKWR